MSHVVLDKIDLKILNELQHDAGLTNVELAARVNLSPSPCMARVRTLERLGVIDRRVALINPAAMGFRVTAFVHVELEQHSQEALINFCTAIENIGEIMECYLMIGDNDYLLRVVLRNLQDLDDLIVERLSKIPGVHRLRSSLALRQIQRRTALPFGTEQSVQVTTGGLSRRSNASHGPHPSARAS